jgi:clan AA aspartic protease
MGFVHTEVVLSNPRTEGTPLHASALVDTGALHLCLPEPLARQLDLPFERFRRVTFADGRQFEAPYVGPVRVAVGDRECYVGAMVFGDEVLLGAIPMEDLDLLVDPARHQLVPRDPRGPVSVAKGVADLYHAEEAKVKLGYCELESSGRTQDERDHRNRWTDLRLG